uniref:U2A'/phosphoprotein 32 family A C-terminal domain-containing protein n=1 Tax=Phytophthora ramorum TaxID=164328 RepID=H3HC60_PHYRM
MEGLSRVDRVVDDSGYAFTALDVIDKGLVSLEPIRSYSHLLYVNASKNQIVDTMPLSELQYLSLDISGNQITALQGLESGSLSELKINGNALTSLVGLQNLPLLTTLEASRNSIEDISSLANDASAKLETLHLDENKLETFTGIENLPLLTSVSFQQNYVETLTAVQQLEQLTKLTTLNLTGNPVTQVEDYRPSIVLLAPTLTQLDGEPLTDEDRLAAVELKQRREAEAAEQEEANE